MKKPFVCLAAVLAVVMWSGPGECQQVPLTHAEALDKSVVNFPPSPAGKPLVLVISFSRKGQKQCDGWNHRLKPAYMDHSRADYYELVDFQGVPSFVMRMILHGMRREVPKDEHPNFVILHSNESEWKKLVAYSRPEDAYLLVADRDGEVLWLEHGALTDAKFSELQAEVAKLSPH